MAFFHPRKMEKTEGGKKAKHEQPELLPGTFEFATKTLEVITSNHNSSSLH